MPFTAKDRKDELDRHFKIEGIPSVIMLKREGGEGGFTLMEGGRDGRNMLSQPPNKLIEAFEQWCQGGTPAIYQLRKDLGELEQSVSLVLLCEHLPTTSPGYKAMLEFFETVQERWTKKAKDAPREWQKLKFFISPAPVREPSRWFRTEAKLPGVCGGKEDLEVVCVENVSGAPKVYSMREWCAMGKLPFGADELRDDDGRLVDLFLERFASLTAVLPDDCMRAPVCRDFGLAPDADTHKARIKQDVGADTPMEEAPYIPPASLLDDKPDDDDGGAPDGQPTPDAAAQAQATAPSSDTASGAPASAEASAAGAPADAPGVAPPLEQPTAAIMDERTARAQELLAGMAMPNAAEALEVEHLKALKARLEAVLARKGLASPSVDVAKPGSENDPAHLRAVVKELIKACQGDGGGATGTDDSTGANHNELVATRDEFRACRRELQLALAQNVRLRRLTLRAVGVAPHKPRVIAYAEEALVPRADEIESADDVGAMGVHGGTMRHAARRIVALNLHLLHGLHGEKVLLGKLYGEMRRLTSLVLASTGEWATEAQRDALDEPLRTLCITLEESSIDAAFEHFRSMLGDVGKQARDAITAHENTAIGDEDGVGNGQSTALAAEGEEVSAEETAERCIRLGALLATMRELTDQLLDEFGERAAQWIVRHEAEQAESARDARERARQEEQARREAEEEHLFVEDERDTPERHPLQTLPANDDEPLRTLINGASVVVVVFGGSIGEAKEGGGVERPHEASKALWYSKTDAADGVASHHAFCEPPPSASKKQPAPVSALAHAAERLMHGHSDGTCGFKAWYEPAPLVWRHVELDAHTSALPLTWGDVPALGSLAGKWETRTLELPAAVVFVDGVMDEPVSVATPREVYEYALAKAEARAALAHEKGEMYRPVFLPKTGGDNRLVSLLENTWRQQLDGWASAISELQRATVDGQPLEKPNELLRGSAAWTWRCGAFAAAFAPRALADCNLEGRPPRMKPHIFRFLHSLRGALSEQGPLLTGADVSHHHRLPAPALSRAAAAFRLMGPLLEFEDLVTAAEDPQLFPEALLALQVGPHPPPILAPSLSCASPLLPAYNRLQLSTTVSVLARCRRASPRLRRARPSYSVAGGITRPTTRHVT